MRLASALLRAAFVTLVIPSSGVPVFAQHWSPVSNPDPMDQIEIFLPTETVLLAGSTVQGEVYASSDHGTSWSRIASDLPNFYALTKGLVRVGDWLLFSRQHPNGFNYRSHFDGTQWEAWQPLSYQEHAIRSFAVIGQTVFAVLFDGRVHRSDDYGTTWAPVSRPGIQAILQVFAHEGRLFASEHQINMGMIYRSDDMGASWVPIGNGLGSSYVSSHEHWQGRLLLSLYHNGGIGSFWASTDLGDSWSRVQTLPTSGNINGMAVAQDGSLAVGAAGATPGGESIWLSVDLAHWQDYTGDLPESARPFKDLVAHEGWFFKTGGSATSYRVPQPPTAGLSENVGDPSGSLRLQPNPARGGSTLCFTLDRPGQVDFGIYDLSGKQIAFARENFGPGMHRRLWDLTSLGGRGLPAGVYLIRLAAPAETRTIKLVVSR